MWKKASAVLVIIVLLVLAYGCKERTQVKGIDLDVTFAEEELSDNLITDMTLTWKTSEEFVKMNQDLQIYVHFWHKDNLLFQEDYIPAMGTEPGICPLQENTHSSIYR